MSARRSPPSPAAWAGLVLLATAAAILGTRLVFVPVPWADGSAFYLPGLDLVHWPPHWRAHAQAAFVPSYDQANFNNMPALPLLLGLAARSGALRFVGPELLIRIVSLAALLGWAWLLWSWLLESLGARASLGRARLTAALIAVAGLWDPVLRWGTLVVRTETWIGLCWLWILRELHRWESHELPGRWERIAWRISTALALAAYFHFEAVYLLPAVVVGLGFTRGWFLRLLGIAGRTAFLLLPWLAYVALHPRLFAEQMEVQFHRLAHANPWMSSAYQIFHSLFIDLGSPAGLPKFFNLAKGLFWLGIAGLTVASVTARFARAKPRRALVASAVAFASCFYLWATKTEAWFITLCHLAFWPWAGAALLTSAMSARPRVALASRRTLLALAGGYAFVSLAGSVAQERAISPEYAWTRYDEWVGCIESSLLGLGGLAERSELRLWQPHVPDVLVELSRRHPGWELTRALDFPARTEVATQAGRRMDVILLTRSFNPAATQSLQDYSGPLRERDAAILADGSEVAFGPWALDELIRKDKTGRTTRICEIGPFWAAVTYRIRR